MPASCLTGIEYEKVVGLAVLFGYTKMGCEGHEQFVNALYFPHRDEEKGRVHSGSHCLSDRFLVVLCGRDDILRKTYGRILRLNRIIDIPHDITIETICDRSHFL